MVQMDIQEILRRNPHIDVEALNTSQKMLDALRAAGVQRAQYDLALPYQGRQVRVGSASDPRTVQISNRNSR